MDDSLRTAVDRVGNELFNIVHSDEGRLDSNPPPPSRLRASASAPKGYGGTSQQPSG